MGKWPFRSATAVIPPGATLRQVFVPRPAGYRFCHAPIRAGGTFDLGQYSGLAGPVDIAPEENAGK